MAFSSEFEQWWREASKPGAEESILSRLAQWLKGSVSPKLIKLVQQLLAFYCCPQISVLQKAWIGAALLYCLDPLDLVPDFVPVLGWLDDIAVVTLVLTWVQDQLQRSRLTCPRHRRTCNACD